MKKRWMVLLIAAATVALAAGCRSAKKDDHLKVGGITLSNMNESDLGKMLKKAGSEQKVVFYDDLNTLAMAVESGNIDQANIMGYMAEYAASRNNKLKCEYPEKTVENSMKMAVREDDKTLRDELNSAIQSMKQDGTLDKLTKEYIEDVIKGSDPKPEKINSIAGADTIKVAVTGSFAPFDYSDAEGKPAGFNVAVLNEIGKRLNKNIELVTVSTAARMVALSSKKVDVVFWILSVKGNDSADVPSGIVTTDSFCTSDAGTLKSK